MRPDNLQMPGVVRFRSGGTECRAFAIFDSQYGLCMHTCAVNFHERPKVNLEYLPHTTRVLINDGEIWVDTDNESAAAIEALFLTGKAPLPSRQ